MPPITINLCGRLTVERDGTRREDALPGRQGRLAVAYLALNHRRPVSREELIGAIWGEDAERGHAQGLNVVLSKVRRAIGPDAIEGVRRGSLQLTADAHVDVEEAAAAVHDLQERVARADWYSVPMTARSIIAKATRGLLVELDAPWIEEARREFETLALDARDCLAQAALAVGDLARAERQARKAVEIAPWRESGYVRLMEVLEAGGNVAEALRVYDGLRAFLREELGVPPSARVQAVADRLLRPAPPAPGKPDAEPAPADAEDGKDARAQPAEQRRALPFFATRNRASFVGRRTELERLRRYFERAAGGTRQLVLLEGEPGIGKTRLAATFSAECHATGATVLYGRCDAEPLIPYQPLLEAIRAYVGDVSRAELRDRLGVHARELARVLPELERDDDAPLGTTRAETERYRLFEAVSALLVDAALQRPVVLVLDDLHWADRPTLLMIRQVVRATEGASLLVLITYRDTEQAEALQDTLADMRREQFVERISLSGLADEEASTLIRALAPRTLPQDVEAPLREETMGNPFFLEEMVRSYEVEAPPSAERRFEPGGRQVPEGIRDVLGRRVTRLSERTRRMLEAAAVMGREFAIPVLEGLEDLRGDDLDANLDEALGAQVILEVPGDWERYTFSHALISQTLYSGLSRRRRARLHADVAQALEARAGEDPTQLSSLAHHYFHAQQPALVAKAIDYAERAARHADGQLAYEEAARLYDRAVEQLERAGGDPDRRTCLMLALGESHLKGGNTSAARAAFAAAHTQARERGDAVALARAALGHGTTGHMAGGVVDRTTVAKLTEALEAVGTQDTPLRSRLLARLGIELRFSEDDERRAELPREALGIARRLDDPASLGYALIARHWCLWGPENVDERLRTAEDLLALAERCGDKKLAGQGHRWRMIDMLELGDLEAVDAGIGAFAQLAEERRQLSDRFYLQLFRAMRALLAGRFGEVEPLSREAAQLGKRMQDPNASQAHVLQLIALRREQGRLEELREPVREHVERFAAIPGWRCVLAYVQAELGDDERARAELDAFGEDDFAALPLDGLWLGGIALLAEATAAIRDARHAEALYQRLLPYANRNVAIGWASVCVGSASRHLGLLAGLLGRRHAAAGHFEDALALNTRMGAEPWVARTELAYAELLLESGEDRRARELLARAHERGAALGMVRLVADAGSLDRRRAPVTSA